MSKLLTNVTIKFTSKEEVEKAIDRLVELGYTNDTNWNNDILFDDEFWELNQSYFIHIYNDLGFSIYNHKGSNLSTKLFESFSDFAKLHSLILLSKFILIFYVI